ncbi:MAG: CaiB/BaiF CoA transferase family protein [Dehalococcoidia bacterium]
MEIVNGPLAGVRGIVLTQAWAGTYCTELLAFMGVDLIQIEVLQRPDAWRGSYDAPLAGRMKDVPTAEHSWNCNFLYNSVNLNKRCITLNLQHPDGMAVFKRLLPFADVVVENFSPRVLGNLGIDYEAMREIKSDVILCSLSAYGHTGPWANIPGIGGTIEPTSGMSALLGYPDGGPMNSGQMYPDAVAGLNGFAALVTALRHRQQTGEGQYIDLSMQEANLVFAGDAALEYIRTGRQRPRQGNRHPRWAPHGIFRCSGEEQWVALSCESQAHWAALKKILAAPALDAPEFATNDSRKAHEDALEGAIEAATSSCVRDELVAALQGEGIPAAPVLSPLEVAADPALRARNVVMEVTHPEAGTWPQSGVPWHFSSVPNPPLRPAPRLGEHSAEVLAELLGTTAEEYDSLVAAGVSGIDPPR